MSYTQQQAESGRYARCIEVSKRIRWDIENDVIRGRRLDFSRKFLPDGISQVHMLEFLNEPQRRLLSQVQGRTYANMFRLVERFISVKMLEVSRTHGLGDQVKLEALVRFTDEELKHQELFRRLERMAAEGMPPGYRFVPQENDVASLVLGKSTWAVLGLTCHIELFVLAHYHASIDRDPEVSELYKDVFLYHAREESQHAILDELEWRRENANLSAGERDHAVDELIELVGAVDGLLRLQANADAGYFRSACTPALTPEQSRRLEEALLKAYRWQYIVSGVQDDRFLAILGDMITPEQSVKIGAALAPIVN